MCLIVFAYKSHPRYKLIIGANRDEFYKRKTSPADFWEEHPKLLGGRDLEGGGTWMGVTKDGSLSMLTNYRDLRNLKSQAPTRGKLVSNYLIAKPPVSSYLDDIDKLADQYNDYNLILGNPDDLWYYSNVERKKYMLGTGVYGLSNHLLDTPWHKVEKAKETLRELMKHDKIDPEQFLDLLFNDLKAADDQLPETGIGIEMERIVSSIFIKSPDYGTRCSTIVLVDENNNLEFVERTFNTDDFSYQTRSFDFNISPRGS